MAPCGNEHPLECAQVTSEVAHVTHVDRISFSSQHGRGHVLAADGVLDSLLGVFHAQPVARQLLPVPAEIQEIPGAYALGERAARPSHAGQQSLNVGSHLLNPAQIGA